MLNPKAQQLLRCTALTRSGNRCRAYIVGGLEVCISHSPWRSRGPGSKRPPIRPGRVACRCEAYTWPHRRGSGVCRWPDPPETPCTIPAGTRRSTRLRSIQQAQKLELHQLSKHPKTTLPELQDPIEPTVVCLSRVISEHHAIFRMPKIRLAVASNSARRRTHKQAKFAAHAT